MRLARDAICESFAKYSKISQNLLLICKLWVFFLRNGAAYRPNGLLPPHTPPHTSHPSPFTPHLTPHFTSRLCDLRHNPLG